MFGVRKMIFERIAPKERGGEGESVCGRLLSFGKVLGCGY